MYEAALIGRLSDNRKPESMKPLAESVPSISGWRSIEFGDVPSREEFEELTLKLLRKGVTNSDQMRNEIRTKKQLILKKATGRWNGTPSDKFVNEHAWVVEDLVVRHVIESTAEKEYRLLSPDEKLPDSPEK